ncbi:MAG: hypothetical protein GX913_08105 [Clostridiales bacterium]|nr:hypothetical protein [Clostridiales bacterium]
MDIRIIKNTEDVEYYPIKDDLILLIGDYKREIENIQGKKYTIFRVDSNEKEEVMPLIHKYKIWDIIDIWSNVNYLYFSECNLLDKGKVEIIIYRYHLETEQCVQIYTSHEELSIYPTQKKVKLFVLDENYLLIQHEYLKTNSANTYQSFFDFELLLYNIKEKTTHQVTDESLSIGGIEKMLPISKNICAIKTGFNLLKDNRFSLLDKSEAVIENIGFVNVKQLISDILLKQENVFIDVIDQAYFTKTFCNIKVMDNYLIYSRIIPEENKEEIVFYKYSTKEIKVGINQGITSIEDLSNPVVLDGTPYIILKNEDRTDFYNLINETTDLYFEEDVIIKEVYNDMIMTEKKVAGKLLKKPQSFIDVYQYPKKNLLLHENSPYIKCISMNSESLYVFIK